MRRPKNLQPSAFTLKIFIYSFICGMDQSIFDAGVTDCVERPSISLG